jgi:hypothetical protein
LICTVSAGVCRLREALQLRRRDEEAQNYIASVPGSKGSPDMPTDSVRENERRRTSDTKILQFAKVGDR